MNLPKTYIPNNSSPRGFTLIEILMTLAIITLLASMGLAVSVGTYRSYAFNTEQDILMSLLMKTRQQALTNVDEAPHGLFITPSEYVLFEGASYAARAQSKDEHISADAAITKSGLNEVVFSQLAGESNASGTIMLASGTRVATATITYEGQINF